MGKRLKTRTGKRQYLGIEEGLAEANKNYISADKQQTRRIQGYVHKIVERLINGMKKESPAFKKLYKKQLEGASCYRDLKIGVPDKFDFDLLLKIPEIAEPVLEDNIPGYVQIKIKKLSALETEDQVVFLEIKKFLDEDNYLLGEELKSKFVQSVFDKVVANKNSRCFQQDGTMKFGKKIFNIERQTNGPDFVLTLSVSCTAFQVSIDLVPCILLNANHWPGGDCRPNPCHAAPSDFFVAPERPNRKILHIQRYWRLSFQMQERRILYDRSWLKPTIKIMKRIRDNLNQKVSSYTIETLFFWELFSEDPNLGEEIPELWKGPLSFCIIQMLERYLSSLEDGRVRYFWNENLNLLENLSEEQINKSKDQIASLLEDLNAHPSTDTILKYLGDAHEENDMSGCTDLL